MLIAFPIGLWVFSFVCDVLFRLSGRNEVWDTVSLYSMVGGVVGAAAAAVPGFIDWRSLKRGTATQKRATVHMILNVTAVLLYILNVWWRLSQAVKPF